MRRSLPIVAISLAAAALAAPSPALAVEFKNLGGRPLTIDITNTAITNYHFDNRNDLPGLSEPQFKVDDNYFEFLDRFNIQLGYWRLRLNVRLDASAFAPAATEDNTAGYVIHEIKKAQAAGTLAPNFTSNDAYNYQSEVRRELHTRFPNAVYPAKLSLTYQQPGVEATVGDFYAQLGRGLVLSVRKIDELAVDTTIRGGKLQLSKSFGSLRVGGTLLGGLMNPLRVDEATGRVLNGQPSPLFFGFPEARPLTVYQLGTDKEVVEAPVPSYLQDAVIGGRLEAGVPFIQGAGNVSVLLRNTPGDQIRTWSGSLNLPTLTKYADLYVEVAGQQLVDAKLTETPGLGYAVYVNANVHAGPLSLSLEGKHYRRLNSLSANVDTTTQGFNAAELSLLAYNQPPTAEPIYVEPLGSPNVCVTGGRARADYRFNRDASVYGWLGYYASFSELSANASCDESPENRTNAWDAAAGADLSFEGGKTYVKAWMGGRIDDTEAPATTFQTDGAPTNLFYQEGYIRYDIVKHLTGAFSLQSQGFHRRRSKRENFKLSWWEGENYLALQWAPRLAAVFGYEYTDQEGCHPGSPAGELCHYLSGGLTWRGAASDGVWGQIFNTVGIFIGQRRAAIRCVSGVCRQFPPFEGAKLEVVSRF